MNNRSSSETQNAATVKGCGILVSTVDLCRTPIPDRIDSVGCSSLVRADTFWPVALPQFATSQNCLKIIAQTLQTL